jgi:c-di-GMP-binding flagellar brake protein YcgR
VDLIHPKNGTNISSEIIHIQQRRNIRISLNVICNIIIKLRHTSNKRFTPKKYSVGSISKAFFPFV